MANQTKGKLYLIPTLLGGENTDIIPQHTQKICCSLSVFIVENVRTARRHLVRMGIKQSGKQIDELTFYHLDKHTTSNRFNHYLDAALTGQNIGLLSEAGCPAIADPGAYIVQLAHQKNIEVVPLVGPSSILLALMASGLNGQQFAFNGYLPIQAEQRKKRIKQLENKVLKSKQTQICIEAPYRNNNLLKDLIQQCRPNTHISVATNLTLPTQQIHTKTAKQWRALPQLPNLHKKASVFLIGNC